ncbi:hypothetical protein DH2020_040474 [Rehmannia glutinosa]|uniref:VQ domain-containing protein n=1 Tax=Rehmannia glutinosa TaxID=99300 RepID=A0ABR0USU9_REHGL
MDSGNSGSLQSSSGGDEEYDSRANASVSAFMSGGPPPLFFDPFSSFLQLHQNPNPDSAWPRTTIRTDPNPITHDIISPMLPSSSPALMPSFQPAGADNSSQSLAPPQQNQNQTTARNPKKRSRASRRAPTTVLTTDTTNFRAMVQEFTGIPAPPFDNSSINFPIRSSRLDLLGTRSSSFDSPPPYIRRPFAQKVQPPALPFLASSTPSSINYQLPITQTSSNLFNINNQNPLLTSLLQSNPKSPISNSPLIEQFGLNQVSPNLINHTSSDHTHNAARWRNSPVSPDAADKQDDGDYNFNQRNTTTTSFQGGKGPPGEGMVESWICSSE